MDEREFIISLTGADSRKAVIPGGQGSFSIGTKGISKGEYDKEKYPYGDWPRWFYYSGKDTGFTEWSCKRKNADIFRLSIHTEEGRTGCLEGVCK